MNLFGEEQQKIQRIDKKGALKGIYRTLGASNHVEADREVNDYYATDPIAAEWLLKIEKLHKKIWEPACGQGHLSEVFKHAGHEVKCTDLINRFYGDGGIDFLKCNEVFDGDIITNPPFKYADKFIEKSLDLIMEGNKVAMFLKLQFMESGRRRSLFTKTPPIRIWVSSNRIACAKNGDFKALDVSGGSAVAYAWYVWQKGFIGDTVIKWFN